MRSLTARFKRVQFVSPGSPAAIEDSNSANHFLPQRTRKPASLSGFPSAGSALDLCPTRNPCGSRQNRRSANGYAHAHQDRCQSRGWYRGHHERLRPRRKRKRPARRRTPHRESRRHTFSLHYRRDRRTSSAASRVARKLDCVAESRAFARQRRPPRHHSRSARFRRERQVGGRIRPRYGHTRPAWLPASDQPRSHRRNRRRRPRRRDLDRARARRQLSGGRKTTSADRVKHTRGHRVCGRTSKRGRKSEELAICFQSAERSAGDTDPGRERAYLAWIFATKSTRHYAIDSTTLEEYTRQSSEPGAMRAGFAWYRENFSADGLAQAKTRASKRLTMPVLALGGSDGVGDALRATVATIGDRVQGGPIGPDCGHFLPEECPVEMTDAVLKFWQSTR